MSLLHYFGPPKAEKKIGDSYESTQTDPHPQVARELTGETYSQCHTPPSFAVDPPIFAVDPRPHTKNGISPLFWAG